MLSNLLVKNLALIDETEIDFRNGLNILTGETGAGKSIVLGSINIALGGKVSADIIRKGAEYALTQLTFHTDDVSKIKALKAMDIEELDDGDIIISRKITFSRSQIKVNGQSCTAGQVKAIAALLIDIHGQHDNQLLLNENSHLDMVDEFSLAKSSSVKAKLKEAYHKYTDVKTQLSSMNLDTESRKREIAFLQFEVDEIENANLLEQEDEQLESHFRKLSNMQKIMEDMANVDNAIISGENNVCDLIGTSIRFAVAAAAFDDGLQPLADTLADIESMLSDASHMISEYIEESSFDDEDFLLTQQRLDLINSLKMKYGKDISDILQYCDEKKAKLDELHNYESISKKLSMELAECEKAVSALSQQLSVIRHTAAKELCAKIVLALKELNFVEIKFEPLFEKAGTYTVNGNDTMRFMISTNPGEDLKPLSKVASGGELSRIMLAIKTVIAGQDDIGTLIFDEIDSGISGRTAQMTALKLAQLSKYHQIICITHLPQIASMSDVHFMIEKYSDGAHTATQIYELDEESSVKELARLLGGTQITNTVILNAKEMKTLANQEKLRLQK